ncbi:MAG: 50S ribosomal protein L21, partial [Methyloceanibacter sp.]
MFAVIRTGGKQYRVAPNDVIEIERIAGESGDIIELGEVLLLGGDSGPKTGSPTIAGALVAAELVEQTRGDKIIVFKKKRRKGYRRTRGHRQDLTMLRITEILTDGKKPSQTKVARPEPKKTEAKKPEAKKPEAKKPEAKKADAKKAAAKPAKKPAAKKPTPVKKAAPVNKAAPAAKKAAPTKK